MSDQALVPTAHCTNFKCQKWVEFGGEAVLSKPQLMLKGKYWCCPKCGSSYGEHAKEGLMEQSKVKLPELSELEALRIVCRLARMAAVDKDLLLPDLKKKFNGYADQIQSMAIAQVEELIETTEEGEKDPIKHGLDFLKENGCFVFFAIMQDDVIDEIEEDTNVEPGSLVKQLTELNNSKVTGVIAQAVQLAREGYSDVLGEMVGGVVEDVHQELIELGILTDPPSEDKD
jgi:hypothetical protein